ncbi:hypothetical protein D9619_005959 [Psilocybe cf. subviscida]|uniref:Uncharacterized protein n=1 Tax=Psilocybe cf. subviscida TaxID=2480587 RepID=A0A8H5FC34_9AGAR|nr:hypothetical protein D9619_005959 [Psilocybe cf. subviscida]
MTLLEDYIQRDENFNLTGKRRKDWQNGSVKHGRYQIEHKLFAHSGNNYAELQGAELDGVHPWLIDAIKAQSAPQKYNINVPFPLGNDFVISRLAMVKICFQD